MAMRMKSVIINERRPRKYTPLKRVILTDDAGMVWATIDVSDGNIRVTHLDGVRIHTNQLNGMGDYVIGDDVLVPYLYAWCPNCESGIGSPKVYDQNTKKVTCAECGHTWELKKK